MECSMQEWQSISTRPEPNPPVSDYEIRALRIMCDVAHQTQRLRIIACQFADLIDYHKTSHHEVNSCTCLSNLKAFSLECVELEKALNTITKAGKPVLHCLDQLEETNSFLHTCLSQVIKNWS